MEGASRINASVLRAVALGLISTVFFSMTFVLNRKLVVTQGDGSWAWGVILRYLFTFLLLTPIVLLGNGVGNLPQELRRHWWHWLVWSVVGFGVFGIFLTWAASSGPAWLVAGGWQITIIAGPLLATVIYKDNRRHLAFGPLSLGLLIVGGVLAMEYSQAEGSGLRMSQLIPFMAVVIAAFAYPLGNRMLLLHLERCGCQLSTIQRVFGMTLVSLCLWLPMAVATWKLLGPPRLEEVLLGGGVALFSGVIGTTMFFAATALVQQDRVGMAAVEAMQGGEILFSVLLGSLLLGEAWPRPLGIIGAILIIVAIVLFNFISSVRPLAECTTSPASP
jgi:drug/metabolite transporter (DMT)-like permease